MADLMLPVVDSIAAGDIFGSISNYLGSSLVQVSGVVQSDALAVSEKVHLQMMAVSKVSGKASVSGKSKSKDGGKGKSMNNKSGKGNSMGKGKGINKGINKGKLPKVHNGNMTKAPEVVDGIFTLKRSAYSKQHKGGQKADPSCDNFRRVIYVHVYNDGQFKDMWNIEPTGNTITNQTTLLYEALSQLIIEDDAVKQYVVAPEMGHPWFPRMVDMTTAYLKSITITLMQHKCLWHYVCTDRANAVNRQSAINKLIIPLGFSQDVLDSTTGNVKFTFDVERYQSQARALLKYGVGGGENSQYKGRPTIAAIPTPV